LEEVMRNEKDKRPPHEGASDNAADKPVVGTHDNAADKPDVGTNDKSPKPVDPFDPASLRLTQDFLKTGGVAKHYTTIPARKPGAAEWFRLHPAADYRLDTLILEMKSEGVVGGETYLIAPHLHGELAAMPMVSARRLYFGVTRLGTPFVWPVRLPSADGRPNSWTESALEAVAAALKNWIRLEAVMSAQGYVFYTPLKELAEPKWPDMTFAAALRLAYRDRLIDSMDHILLQKLRGEV